MRTHNSPGTGLWLPGGPGSLFPLSPAQELSPMLSFPQSLTFLSVSLSLRHHSVHLFLAKTPNIQERRLESFSHWMKVARRPISCPSVQAASSPSPALLPVLPASLLAGKETLPASLVCLSFSCLFLLFSSSLLSDFPFFPRGMGSCALAESHSS